jgi:hypothetical protein
MSDENVDVGFCYSRVFPYCNYSCMEEKAMKQSPCKGCLKRSAHPNCHITCDLYAEFVHYRQMYNAERQKRNIICDYIKKKREKDERAKHLR